MSEVRVRVSRLVRNSDSQYLLVLQDDASHLLPMVIGPCEAMAIGSVLRPQGEAPVSRRPTTHDLVSRLIEGLGGRVTKVVIDDLWNGVYYAKIHVAVGEEVRTIDARPSDGVAIGLRAEALLYAAESVLAAANETQTSEAPPEAPLGPDLDLNDF